MTTPTKPTHNLSVLDKATGSRGIIGAGWLGPDGTLTIKLNAGAALRWDDGLTIKAFPVSTKKPMKLELATQEDPDERDIPF